MIFLIELYVKTSIQIYQNNTLWVYNIFMKNVTNGNLDYLLNYRMGPYR